jgi:uncharacterized repeat protein (TIGR02543 family)
MKQTKLSALIIISFLLLSFYAYALKIDSAAATPAYSVTFTESGLTSGTSWSVTLDGTTRTSTTTHVVFTYIADGAHNYTIDAQTGYYASTTSGTLTVSGANAQQSVIFTSQPDTWWMAGNGPTHSGYSTSTGPTTNTQLWSQSGINGVYSSPAVVGGVIYVCSERGYIYAINASTGDQITSYNIGADFTYSSPAVVNGTIYVGATNGTVFALNAATGSKVWTYSTGGSVKSSPAVSNGVVYVGSNDNKVYAFNAATGTMVWSYLTGGSVESSPAIANGMVYVGSDDGKLYALNSTDGTPIWNYTQATCAGVSSPSVADGIVYTSLYLYRDAVVVAINATTGVAIWSTHKMVFGMLPVANGILLVKANDMNVYGYNATDGTQLWSKFIMGADSSDPAIAGNVAYFKGEFDFYAVNVTTGAQIWRMFSMGMGSSLAPSPVVANGVVYLFDDFIRYAFGTLAHYTLTMNTVGHGTVSPGNQTYPAGSQITLQAIPDAGWSFSSWSGNASGSTNTTTILNGNLTVTATFTQDNYTLTMITAGQGNVTPGNSTYMLGTTVDLNAINAAGWAFSGWTGDASDVTNTTITMNGNLTVTATFTQNSYTLTLITNGQGTVTPANQTYLSGTIVDIQAFTADNWTFSGWSGDATGITNTTITMDDNKTVTATFTPNIYDVIFTASGLASGTSWSVVFNGTTQNSTTDTIIFTGYLNGIYDYSISVPEGYMSNSILAGNLTINNDNLTQTVTYIMLKTITFNAPNLPAGVEWSVTLNNITKTSFESTITFEVPIDSYQYVIALPEGYTSISALSGTISEDNLDTPITIQPIAFTTEPTATLTPTVTLTPTPTLTTTTTPAPTTTPESTTTPQPVVSTNGLYLPVIGAIAIIVLVLFGLFARTRKHPNKSKK